MISPRVSVVTTFLDAARFIDEAITSVLAQTLRDWELILVDDGSSDASAGIAESYARQFPDRIRVLRHPGGANLGIAASRNLGIAAARAPYIALLDADDVFEPRRLELHVACLERDVGLGVVLSPELYWHSWAAGSERRDGFHDHVIGPAAETGIRFDPPALIVATLLTKGAPMPTPCSITFRAEALDRDGIPEAFHGHYDDQVLVCKLLLSSTAMVIAEPLARYRQHAASVTRGNSPLDEVPGSPAALARRRFLGWLRQYLRESGLDIPELDDWIDSGLAAIEATAQEERIAMRRSVRWLAVDGARRLLPERTARRLRGMRQRLYASRVRREVMRRIRRSERARSDPAVDADNDARRAYWNERIHDAELSDDPVGTPAFYAALDAYHLRKCDYLLREVDFGRWRDRDVLEIGCGAGLDLVRFARAEAHVTGVDLSRTAIELARGCCRAVGVEACLIEADGASLPLPSESYDLVFCMGVLPFARDPAAIVGEAHRVLRRGGQAVFMVYNRRSWMSLLAPLQGGLGGHSDAPGFRLYDAAEFDRLLSGFPERRLVTERFPQPSGSRHGLGERTLGWGLVPAWRALPKRWTQPYGWHLLGFCRKAS